jgi:hypothetical protein
MEQLPIGTSPDIESSREIVYVQYVHIGVTWQNRAGLNVEVVQ